MGLLIDGNILSSTHLSIHSFQMVNAVPIEQHSINTGNGEAANYMKLAGIVTGLGHLLCGAAFMVLVVLKIRFPIEDTYYYDYQLPTWSGFLVSNNTVDDM